jgi:sugar lactone lactonase YvrE
VKPPVFDVLPELTGQLAVDASGNAYLADAYNHRVRRIDSSGIITTVAGNGTQGDSGDGGPALAARLSHPHGVAVGADGTLYIADTGNSRVRRVDAAGTITTIAGSGWWHPEAP